MSEKGKKSSIDMTQGNPFQLLLSFTLPMLLGNIFQQFYSMVDSIVVGRFVGVDAFAAIGATGAVLFLMISVIIGFTVGISVVTAQFFGGKQEEMLKKTAATASVLSVLMAAILGVIGIALSRPVLVLLHTPENIMKDAALYLTFNFATCLAPISYNMASNMLRSCGDSKTPLYALIISSLINIVLDLVFVIVFDMGVMGVALATAIAQALSTIFCVIRIYQGFPYMRYSRKELRLYGTIVKNVLRIGIPMSIQNIFTSFGMMAVQSIINPFGSSVVAGYAAANKVDQIGMQPMMAIGNAMSTYAGQNFGAGKTERIQEGVKKASLLGFLVCGLIGLLLIVGGRFIVQLMVSDAEAEVIGIASEYLKIVAAFYILGSLVYIYTNTLRGMGIVAIPMAASFLELGVKVAAAFFLARLSGYHAIWFAWPMAWAASALLQLGYYYMGNWKKKLLKSF